MMYDNNVYFTECTRIPVRTFVIQFCNVITQVIPQRIIKKYINCYPTCITMTLSDIGQQLNNAFTLKELHDAFLRLTAEEQKFVIIELNVLLLDLNAMPDGTLVYVPEDPKEYAKPFFFGLFTRSNMLR